VELYTANKQVKHNANEGRNTTKFSCIVAGADKTDLAFSRLILYHFEIPHPRHTH
jgi:hypothetical protein